MATCQVLTGPCWLGSPRGSCLRNQPDTGIWQGTDWISRPWLAQAAPRSAKSDPWPAVNHTRTTCEYSSLAICRRTLGGPRRVALADHGGTPPVGEHTESQRYTGSCVQSACSGRLRERSRRQPKIESQPLPMMERQCHLDS